MKASTIFTGEELNRISHELARVDPEFRQAAAEDIVRDLMARANALGDGIALMGSVISSFNALK